MNDRMTPPTFKRLLIKVLEDYRTREEVLGVKLGRKRGFRSPLGPAAGPHTQLAGNIVAAFIAGADHFELKTVQIMEGDALGIKKPCIDTSYEVFNIEWSTELTVQEAMEEYIKAYIINYVLAVEYGLADPRQLHYIMSVGYDLAGITSPKITKFMDGLQNASDTMIFKEAIDALISMEKDFEHITREDIDNIPGNISDTVTLSTMHGCKKEEITSIASYLMKERGLNTYVKLNPTLLGKGAIEAKFNKLGYQELTLEEGVFEQDMVLEEAEILIRELMEIGRETQLIFGVKLTNTLPVKNPHRSLEGEAVYMSGPALFPITLSVAGLLADRFGNELPISYSGGADEKNIERLVACGFYPVTVSSVLLKPGGYGHLTKMNQQLDHLSTSDDILVSTQGIHSMLDDETLLTSYQYKSNKVFERKDDYSNLCAACHNCVDTCPNRANERRIVEGQAVVIHYENLCNECGNCSAFCIKGHDPYKEKYTVPSYE